MAYIRRKRFVVKRKRVMRKRRMARKGPRTGVIHLTRKTEEQNVYNTAVAGVAAASGSVVTIGAPYQTPPFAGSTYYNIPFSMDCALSDLVNSTELTAIADKYKINYIKLRLFCTSNTASSGGTSQLPSVLWSTDQDDAGIPASSKGGLDSIREKMGVKVRQFKQNGGPLNIFIRPKVSSGVFGGATVQGAGVIKAPFLDCALPSIPHYGLKGYLQDVNLAATPSVYTQFKFDVTIGVTLRDIQ